MAGAPYQWRHTDSRGLDAAAKVALSRAVALSWSPPAKTPAGSYEADPQFADWRALLWFSFWLACEFSEQTTHTNASGGLVVPGPPYSQSDADRKRVVSALLGTITRIYYPVAKSTKAPTTPGGPELLYTQVATEGDAPGFSTLGEASVDVGALPVAVWIVGTVAVSCVAIYLGEKTAEVVDRELSRREETRRMLAFHATLAAMLATHREQEREAGKTLPLTEAERAAVMALENAQRQQLEALKADPGLSSILPNLKNEGGKIVEATKSVASTAVVVVGLIVAVALYSAMKGK